MRDRLFIRRYPWIQALRISADVTTTTGTSLTYFSPFMNPNLPLNSLETVVMPRTKSPHPKTEKGEGSKPSKYWNTCAVVWTYSSTHAMSKVTDDWMSSSRSSTHWVAHRHVEEARASPARNLVGMSTWYPPQMNADSVATRIEDTMSRFLVFMASTWTSGRHGSNHH